LTALKAIVINEAAPSLEAFTRSSIGNNTFLLKQFGARSKTYMHLHHCCYLQFHFHKALFRCWFIQCNRIYYYGQPITNAKIAILTYIPFSICLK
jgi:hypothetical protein